MHILEIIVLLYFGYVSMYSFVLSAAGLFSRQAPVAKASTQRRIAVLIPAYKEDQVIVGVAREALRNQYPRDRFDVVVIADSLKAETLHSLRSLPIKVIEVSFDKSTKVRALNFAMAALGDDYDCALILDADNVMEREFLTKMNDLFEAGHRAVQARRNPKNAETPMALLDGLSETINNFIYRQGNAVMGLSCPLTGSGMMFEFKLCKNTLSQMDSVGGFDRELELRLLEQGVFVHYAKDVVVYDEKVQNQQVFEHQRKRWLSSHLIYLREYFHQGWKQLFRGNLGYFNSAVLRNMQLPRLLNLGLLTGTLLLSLIFADYLLISPWIWGTLLLLNIAAIIFAIPRRLYGLTLIKSVLILPRLFARMFLLLFRLKGVNRAFLHTPHSRVSVDNKTIS